MTYVSPPLTTEYLDYLARAGCETNDYLRNEAELKKGSQYPPPKISIAEAIRVFNALIYLEGKERGFTGSRIKSFQNLYNNKISDDLFD